MAQVFGNNLSTVLTAPITALDTNLPILVASGDAFPQVRAADDDFFLLTLVGLTGLQETSWEIIKVTDIGSNSLTVVERGQDGTTAQTWPSGTRIEMRLTAGISTRHEVAYNWGDHSVNDYATNAYVNNEISTTLTYIDNEVASLVDSAPGTLDTLQELASALGDDPNFATSVATSIGTKWTEDATKLANWDAAFSYGDHSTMNYQVADADGSALTNVNAASIYVSESTDDDEKYELLMVDRTSGGDQYMTPVIDSNGIRFNPSENRLFVDNAEFDKKMGVGDKCSVGYPMSLIDESEDENLTFSIKTGPVGMPRIVFGDVDNASIAWIRYNNVDDSFDIKAGNYTIQHWRANGDLEVHGNVEVDSDLAVTGSMTATGYNDANWNTAYSWGDHGSAGYLVATSLSYNNSDWDAAFGWGDHGAQGYLTASSDGSGLTDVKAAEIYVEESSDDNNYYEVLFAGRENGGNSYMTPQVDYDSITFNPSANRLDVDNIRVWEDLRVDDYLNVGDPSSHGYPMTMTKEDSTSNYTFNIKTSPTGRPRIAFGDTDDSDVGWIRYDNADDSFDIRAGAYTIMHWRADGDLEIHGNCEVDDDLLVTGAAKASRYNESYVEVSSTSGIATIDGAAGNVFGHTLTEGTTFVFSNPPNTGTAYGFTLKIKQNNVGSGFPVVWQNTVNWASGIAPTLTSTAGAIDIFTFFTHNGGADWFGFTAGKDLL
jgi:hypothetical protein